MNILHLEETANRSRIIHHNDCTWCIQRLSSAKEKNKAEIERCALTKLPLPEVWDTLARLCNRYQQRNCLCEACNSNVINGN